MSDRVELGSVVYRILFETGDTEKATKQVSSAFNEIGGKAKNLGNEMSSASTGAKKLGSSFGEVGKGAGGAVGNLGRFKNAMLQGIGIGTGFTLVTKAIQGVVGAIKGSFNAAVEFESAFAGVRKTVDASEEEFAQLEKGIRQMSKEVPIAVTELARIGELGGQLGVGVDALETFIKTIAQIGVTTNLTEEEAATSFARIANIMQEPITNIDRMGASVVGLGNNFATTEAEIVSFATNIAGVGNVVGLSTADILALGAAFSSVGVEAGVGATSVQKTLLTINSAVAKGGAEMAKFAKISGLSADEFATKWRTTPVEAFADFINGLGEVGDKGSIVIEDLIGGDERLTRVLLSLAGAGDLVNRTIQQSNVDWEKNQALIDEANKRFATTESQIQLTKNKINDLGITIGQNMKGGYLQILKWLDTFLEGLNAAVPVIVAFGKILQAVFITVRNTIGQVLVNIILFLNGFLRDLWNNAVAIKDIVVGIGKTFLALPKLLGAIFQDIGSSFSQTFKNIADKIPGFNGLIATIGGALQGVKKGFSSFLEGAKNFGIKLLDIFNRAKEGVKNFAGSVKDYLAGKLESAFGAVSKSFDDISSSVENSTDDIGKAISDSMNQAEKDTVGVVDKIKGALSDILVIDTSRSASAMEEFSSALGEVGEASSRLGFDNTAKAFKQIEKSSADSAKGIVDAWKDIGSAFNIDTRKDLLANQAKRAKDDATQLQKDINQALEGVDPIDLDNLATGGGKLSDETQKQLENLKLLGDEIDKNAGIYARISDSYKTIEQRASEALSLQKSEWESLFDVISDGNATIDDVDKAYNTALGSVAKQLGDLESKHKNINSAIDDIVLSTKEYQDTADNNQLVLDSYEAIEDAVKRASEKVKQLKEEIAGIDKSLEKNTENYKTNIAKNVVEAEKRLSELRAEMSKGGLTDERRSDLSSQIAEQEAIIESARKLNVDFSAELQRLREEASMNAIELLSAQYEAEQTKLEEQKALKEKQLQDELLLLEQVKAQENLIYENQKNTLIAIEEVLTTAYRENMKARLTATEQFVNGAIELYNKLAEAARQAQRAGANLSTGAMEAVSKYKSFDITQGTAEQQKVNQITQNINIEAKIDSEMDINVLAKQLSLLLKEQTSQ